MDNTENKKPLNPPAFPTMEHGSDNVGCPTVYTTPGATLRDYFAAKAIPQILLSWRDSRPFDFEGNGGDCENIAKNCYLLADEMLKQREL